jgi:vancomycin permeability regulator SanA
MVAAVGAFALAFPLGQMFCFGKTDYARRADAAVVFGARAYADGRCSTALADRVRTGVGLYKRGMVRMLVFSGGPGDGDVTEPQAMRRLAMLLGVPDEAILLDEHGLNTRATVANTTPMLQRMGVRRVLAVSHYYHLPRIKMAYRRADAEVYTVPANEQYVLTQMPYMLAREIAAFWVYYLRPGVS